MVGLKKEARAFGAGVSESLKREFPWWCCQVTGPATVVRESLWRCKTHDCVTVQTHRRQFVFALVTDCRSERIRIHWAVHVTPTNRTIVHWQNSFKRVLCTQYHRRRLYVNVIRLKKSLSEIRAPNVFTPHFSYIHIWIMNPKMRNITSW